MKIIGYTDFDGKNIINQIEVANKLNINDIILRYYDEDISLLDITKEDLKNLILTLKKSKKSVYAIDPIDLVFQVDNLDYNANFERLLAIAEDLKCQNIIFRLPKFNNIIDEFDMFNQKFSLVVELAKKYGKTILIKQENTSTNTIAYILKKYNNNKNISVIFSPADALLTNDSPLAGYRVLKEYFQVFIASDIDKLNNPELLGYGRVGIIDLFKRMKRDKYKGDCIIDERFINFFNNEEIKKVPLFKKLFKSKSLFDKYLEGYATRVFPNEKDRIPNIYDIYLNQINIINIVFNR